MSPRLHYPAPHLGRALCGQPLASRATHLAATAGDVTCRSCRRVMNEPWHGTHGGYANHRCRCAACTQANTEKQREIRDRLSAGPVPAMAHGTTNGYTNYRCRCYRCTKAHSASRRAWREEKAMERARLMEIVITSRRKSSASGLSNCVQVGHAECRRAPRKSSASLNGNSVVVRVAGDHSALEGFEGKDLIHVTSDKPGLDVFDALFTHEEWREFVAAVKRGEFDLDAAGLLPVLVASERQTRPYNRPDWDTAPHGW